MSWFSKRKELVFRENVELNTQVTILKAAEAERNVIHQREIAMWTERGDRLSASYDQAKKQIEVLHTHIANLLANPAEVLALKEVIEQIKKRKDK